MSRTSELERLTLPLAPERRTTHRPGCRVLSKSSAAAADVQEPTHGLRAHKPKLLGHTRRTNSSPSPVGESNACVRSELPSPSRMSNIARMGGPRGSLPRSAGWRGRAPPPRAQQERDRQLRVLAQQLSNRIVSPRIVRERSYFRLVDSTTASMTTGAVRARRGSPSAAPGRWKRESSSVLRAAPITPPEQRGAAAPSRVSPVITVPSWDPRAMMPP